MKTKCPTCGHYTIEPPKPEPRIVRGVKTMHENGYYTMLDGDWDASTGSWWDWKPVAMRGGVIVSQSSGIWASMMPAGQFTQLAPLHF